MIELRQLHKRYSLPDHTAIEALKGINLTVKSGEIFGIIGESGAGKSSLIRCVNSLEIPDAGQVIIKGQDLMQLDKSQLRQMRRNIGMIFQHFNLLASRTVYENIAFPLTLTKASSTIIAKRVTELMALTGLSGHQHHYPHELSGGQKQRVAIARALANKPFVLLSDEATSALDPETTHHILQLLKKINTELGLTILLITHEIGVIKEICHRLAILENGTIIEEADVLDFFNRPQTNTAKRFIRDCSLHELPEHLRARLIDQKIQGAAPLWRLSFLGAAAESPLMTYLIRHFSLSVNILQARIECIRDKTIGVMLLEVEGQPEDLWKGKQYLNEKEVHVEEIGYVRLAV